MNASLASIGAKRESMSANGAPVQWFVPQLQMFPLAARRCTVRNRLTGASLELSSGEYAVLSACEGCRPLGEHEALAAQRLSAPHEHRSAIRELLERCARQGLLISLPDLAARFGPTGASNMPPLVDVAIPTADRPRLVLRLLTSAVALQRRTGAAYRWHVFDDSRSADNRRGVVEAIESCPDLEVSYHDLSAVDSLESRLAAAFPGVRREIHSLLAAAAPGEITSGRTMNHELLWFAGRRFLSIDDDALLEPRRPPLERPGVQVGFSQPAAFWYDSLDAAYAACPELPLDPFVEHTQWLGLRMADAWRRAATEGIHVREIPHWAAAYFDSAASVIFTANHLLGDPGWVSFSGQQLAIGAETRAWLGANPEAVRHAFDSQIHWRGYTSLRLAPQTGLSTTTLTGFDDRVLLPPAARAGFATDTMIGELTRCIHPTGWASSLPFALPHLRDSRRRWLSPTEPPVFDRNRSLLASYAHRSSLSIHACDPAARLATLGEAFVDLGAASDATLHGVIEEHAADHARQVAFRVNEQLDDATTPEGWKQVLRQWVGSPLLRLDAEALRQQRLPPDELRTLARDFGRALIAWPRLWAWCRENAQ
jgi:hypothetical protein